jgi:hypothetical protein
MGALCFTRRVRKTRVPKGFKLPYDQHNYDGSQEPTLWLSDYLQVVQILGGTKASAMQSLQLYLTSATRSWLNTLPNESIGSWGNSKVNLQEIFVPPASAQHHWRKLKHVCRGNMKRYILIYNTRV